MMKEHTVSVERDGVMDQIAVYASDCGCAISPLTRDVARCRLHEKTETHSRGVSDERF